MATAFSIVKKHDGHIAVESILGAGATFHVYLPAAPQAVLPPARTVSKPESASGRILVMDDESDIRDLLKMMLGTLGYEAESVSDGAEAVSRYLAAQAAGKPFAAVILDLTVPGGWEARRPSKN